MFHRVVDASYPLGMVSCEGGIPCCTVSKWGVSGVSSSMYGVQKQCHGDVLEISELTLEITI